MHKGNCTNLGFQTPNSMKCSWVASCVNMK